jgi:hypothetical protein
MLTDAQVLLPLQHCTQESRHSTALIDDDDDDDDYAAAATATATATTVSYKQNSPRSSGRMGNTTNCQWQTCLVVRRSVDLTM